MRIGSRLGEFSRSSFSFKSFGIKLTDFKDFGFWLHRLGEFFAEFPGCGTRALALEDNAADVNPGPC